MSNSRRFAVTVALLVFAVGMLLAAVACPAKAADAPVFQVTFSSLANAPGAYGSYWRTELSIANGSDSTVTVRVADPQPGIGKGWFVADVAPGQTWSTSDIIGDLGFEGAYASMFQVFGPPDAATKVSISARTYTTNIQGGTYGVFLPPLTPLSVIEPKTIALLTSPNMRRAFYYYMSGWAPFNAIGYDSLGRKVWELTPDDISETYRDNKPWALRAIVLPQSVVRILVVAAGRPSPAAGFALVYATQADNTTNAPVFLP